MSTKQQYYSISKECHTQTQTKIILLKFKYNKPLYKAKYCINII